MRRSGSVGFCFGGGMTWNLLQAGEQRLAAAIPFYGPAPENPDFSRAKAAVFGDLRGAGERVNASRERAEAALKAAGLTYEVRTFAGAGHAFFNDTGQRYNAEAAEQAWQDVLNWFKEHLASGMSDEPCGVGGESAVGSTSVSGQGRQAALVYGACPPLSLTALLQ